MLKLSTQMTNIPDLSDLPIITRRYIEAAILKNVFDEIQKRFDRKTAEQIIGQACANSAIAHGQDLAQRIDHPANLQDFADILPNWTNEVSLEIEVLEQDKSKMDFYVTRCRYAEMEEEMAPRDIVHLLSCSRDSDFCIGYSPDTDFERIKTIMKDAFHCEFRLKMNTSAK